MGKIKLKYIFNESNTPGYEEKDQGRTLECVTSEDDEDIPNARKIFNIINEIDGSEKSTVFTEFERKMKASQRKRQIRRANKKIYIPIEDENTSDTCTSQNDTSKEDVPNTKEVPDFKKYHNFIMIRNHTTGKQRSVLGARRQMAKDISIEDEEISDTCTTENDISKKDKNVPNTKERSQFIYCPKNKIRQIMLFLQELLQDKEIKALQQEKPKKIRNSFEKNKKKNQGRTLEYITLEDDEDIPNAKKIFNIIKELHSPVKSLVFPELEGKVKVPQRKRQIRRNNEKVQSSHNKSLSSKSELTGSLERDHHGREVLQNPPSLVPDHKSSVIVKDIPNTKEVPNFKEYSNPEISPALQEFEKKCTSIDFDDTAESYTKGYDTSKKNEDVPSTKQVPDFEDCSNRQDILIACEQTAEKHITQCDSSHKDEGVQNTTDFVEYRNPEVPLASQEFEKKDISIAYEQTTEKQIVQYDTLEKDKNVSNANGISDFEEHCNSKVPSVLQVFEKKVKSLPAEKIPIEYEETTESCTIQYDVSEDDDVKNMKEKSDFKEFSNPSALQELKNKIEVLQQRKQLLSNNYNYSFLTQNFEDHVLLKEVPNIKKSKNPEELPARLRRTKHDLDEMVKKDIKDSRNVERKSLQTEIKFLTLIKEKQYKVIKNFDRTHAEMQKKLRIISNEKIALEIRSNYIQNTVKMIREENKKLDATLKLLLQTPCVE